VPCAAPARGKTDLKLPLRAGWQKDPCGLPIVSSIGGVSVAADNLCLWHQGLKRGLSAMTAPIVQTP
jgi:hypothetical protein